MAALAPTNGKLPIVVRGVDLDKGRNVAPRQNAQLRFQGLPTPEGKEAILVLKACMVTPRPAGWCSGMRLLLNGQKVDPQRLINRQRTETCVDGHVMNSSAQELFNVVYAPDFHATERSSQYALRNGTKPCLFELRVTDLLRAGDNTLIIENTVRPEINRTLAVADIRLEPRTPVRPKVKRPAPSGPLAAVVPSASIRFPIGSRGLPKAALELSLGSETFRIQSEFSTPRPAWVKGSNRYFDHQRKIESRDDVIVVHDTFTNLTQENLPLMQRHRVRMPGLKKVWLAGLSPAGRGSSSSDPGNPRHTAPPRRPASD